MIVGNESEEMGMGMGKGGTEKALPQKRVSYKQRLWNFHVILSVTASCQSNKQ